MVKEKGSTDQNVTNGITVSKNSIRPVASNMDITLTQETLKGANLCKQWQVCVNGCMPELENV